MSLLSSDPPARLSLLSTPQQSGRRLNHQQQHSILISPNTHPLSFSQPSSPCWNLLGPGDSSTESNVTAVNDDEAATLMRNNSAANSSLGNDNEELLTLTAAAAATTTVLPPTYSDPKEASLAYHSGLLKSDSSIKNGRRSIRMAVRYQLERSAPTATAELTSTTVQSSRQKSESSSTKGDNEKKNNNNNNNNNEEEYLFLCWISQDGTPHHFRRMHPSVMVRHDNNNNSNKLQGGEITTSSSPHEVGSIRSHHLLVTENDVIETTYPGHAFVFCQYVGMCDGENNQKCSRSEPIIVQEDGLTFFLRRAKKCCDANKEEEEEDGDTVLTWEKYLIVGGYRPGIMPEEVVIVDDDGDNNNPASDVTCVVREADEIGHNDDAMVRSDNNERESDSNHESSNKSIDHSEYNESDDESDDDDDDEELLLQLVCITKKQRTENGNYINTVKQEDDDEDNYIPPSKMICCPGFLSSLTRSKSRHVPPFLATKLGDYATTAYKGEYTITVCLSRLDSTPLDTSNKYYEDVILGGWPCRVEPGCFPPDMTIPGGRNLLRMRFELDLMAASLSLPPDARSKLKHCTPIFINKSQSYGPKVAPVVARDACFHGNSAGWLKKVGMSTDKCGGIEFFDSRHYLSDCDLWGPGGLMVHELSHAWHCKFIKDGYDNQDIINVYNNAMKDGLYNCVRVRGPQGPTAKAYACENQMEYFAELSVAFLGGLGEDEHNKWYPFNRSQLKEHDPRAFAMMCRMWGVEE